MEHTLVRLAETAAWLFGVVFVFAAIGVVATVRWIVDRVTAGERAVESEARTVGDRFHHHDSNG